MSNEDMFTKMMMEATAGMRDGITEVIKAHILRVVGSECSVSELAKKVFNEPARYADRKQTWIDHEIHRAIERHAETIIEEFFNERREALRVIIKNRLTSDDIAGKATDAVLKKIESRYT